MLLKSIRWISFIATTVALAAMIVHLLELPNKLALSGALWLAVQQSVYRGWGPALGPVEVGAVLAAWTLLPLLRRRRPSFALTLVAALCLSAGLALFFAVVAPVNTAFATWTPEALPADWPQYRLRWEFAHAARAALAMVALGALVRAALADKTAGVGRADDDGQAADRQSRASGGGPADDRRRLGNARGALRLRLVPVLRFGFAALLLATGGAKLLDIPGFVAVLGTFRMLPDALLLPSAVVVALVELALALWLLCGVVLAQASLATAMLQTVYLASLGVAYGRGLDIPNCGCFGAYLARPLTAWTLVEDGALLIAAIALHYGARDSQREVAANPLGREA